MEKFVDNEWKIADATFFFMPSTRNGDMFGCSGGEITCRILRSQTEILCLYILMVTIVKDHEVDHDIFCSLCLQPLLDCISSDQKWLP
ncbi:unnamed protein product [Linum trigynum]|uniref:Uncharacterized protein n=1 Tax=Linum trigynum TaxID=586398 RepID=A0AAV2GPN3_9ROSI